MKRFSKVLGRVLGLVSLVVFVVILALVFSSLRDQQMPTSPDSSTPISTLSDTEEIIPTATTDSGVVSQSPLPSPTPQRLLPTATSSPSTVLQSPLPSPTPSPLPPTPEPSPPTPDPDGWLAERLRIVSDVSFEIQTFSIGKDDAIEAAAWSPDSQRIVIDRVYDWDEVSPKIMMAVRDLWVLNLDGTGTLLSQNALAPNWSPDGSHIAYLYRTKPEQYELRLATWPGLRESSLRTDVGLGSPQWVSGNDIVFSALNGEMLSIDSSGQRSEQVSDKRASVAKQMEGVMFSTSPDGNWLAIRPEDQEHKLMLLSLVDGDEWIIPSTPEKWYLFIVGSIAWSPDSRKFAHIATSGGMEIIHVVDVEMKREWDIVPDPAVGDVPQFLSWSPDGNALIFVMRNSLTRADNLYIVNVDGTGLRNLSRDTDCYVRRPLWSPDGKYIFYSEHTVADQTIRPRLLSVSPQ